MEQSIEKTIKIKLDAEEKKDMEVAAEMMRKVRNYFLVKSLDNWCEKANVALDVMQKLINGIGFDECE